MNAAADSAAKDRSASQLDDDRDREELRQRYYGLLQELRVLLPGVQVLVAFLLTAPFAQRFSDLDQLGRTVYGVSLVSGVLSVVAFVTPTAFHRFGGRTARSQRLVWAIRLTRVGIGLMAISLESALFVIFRLIFGLGAATAVTVGVGLAMVVAWAVLPLSVGGRHSHVIELPDTYSDG